MLMNNNQTHLSIHKENEGYVDMYMLAPGISISFNQIYTNSWMKGDSSVFSERMLILNFCINGRCDVSLLGNRYTIVKERQICISTFLPTKDFYYPGRLYEGYFRRKRIEKAAELLESTNLKVIEIANIVGYENQGKFARAFAEAYGASPLEFRRLSK